MNTEIVQQQQVSAEVMETVLINGDLSKLTPPQKIEYYNAFCNRLGLDPVTKPFSIIKAQGKEILYCDRSGAAQLNKVHKISHKITAREVVNGIYVVTAQASRVDGQATESIGAVSIEGLKGEALSNAMMKAETKSKRRSTLDLVGLGIPDESEIGSFATQDIPHSEVKQAAPALPAQADTRKTMTDAQLLQLLDYIAQQTTVEAIDKLVNDYNEKRNLTVEQMEKINARATGCKNEITAALAGV